MTVVVRAAAQYQPSAGAQTSPAAFLFQRARLLQSPSHEVVESFFVTRGAASVLSELPHDGSDASTRLVWIVAPPGGGKTHFLNYLLAMEGGAGVREAGAHRKLLLALGAGDEPERLVAEVTQRSLSYLAAGRQRHLALEQMSATAGLRLALEEAKRQGLRTLTLMLDLADADEPALTAFAAALQQIRSAAHGLNLTIIAAARFAAPPALGAAVHAITAAGDEEIATAIHRAVATLRSERKMRFNGAGRNPFTAAAATVLRSLAPAEYRVSFLAQAAYETLAAETGDAGEALAPAQLFRLAVVANLRDQLLGEQGAAAINAARTAAQSLSRQHQPLAQELIDALVLGAMTKPERPTPLDWLRGALAVKSRGDPSAVLDQLARLSAGIIEVSAGRDTARLNFSAARTPAIVAFNRALPASRAFVPDLAPVSGEAELDRAMARLGVAMADAVERASRAGENLVQLARNCGASLAPEQTAAITTYIALAAKGPAALLDESAGPEIALTIVNYEQLAPLAAAAPQLSAMRDYLCGTVLLEQIHDDLGRDPAVDKLEAEAKFLLVDLEASVRARSSIVLEALESRFERFKWTYAPFYRKAHQHWVSEIRELLPIAGEGARQLAALSRLASIPQLDVQLEPSMQDAFAAVAAKVRPCELDSRIAPELTPQCPSCRFRLGEESPRRELEKQTRQIHRQLKAGLLKLSEAAIARLMREHQDGRRLEGLLKIIEAARAGALAAVLDEDLTAYLKALLEEEDPMLTRVPAVLQGVQAVRKRASRRARRSAHSGPA